MYHTQDHLSEESYVSVVRNQILVDVQGEDLLFQIFTSNILQRKSGDEAPFFEFIQRVCSKCIGADGCPRKIKPGTTSLFSADVALLALFLTPAVALFLMTRLWRLWVSTYSCHF